MENTANVKVPYRFDEVSELYKRLEQEERENAALRNQMKWAPVAQAIGALIIGGAVFAINFVFSAL